MENKVGRPRLADNILKKESIYVVVLCFLIVVMLILMGNSSLNISGIKASASRDNECFVNSYNISSTTVKLVMKCGKNVGSANLMGSALKYKENKLYGYRYISVDSISKISYEWTLKNNKKIKKIYNK